MKASSLFCLVVATVITFGAGVYLAVDGPHAGRAGLAVDPSRVAAADGVTVSIDNFSFMSAEVKVPAGTTVTWINHDDVPHNVVSTEGKFKSKALDTDEKFSFTFTQPGEYPYFCSIHPKMVAKVVVTAN